MHKLSTEIIHYNRQPINNQAINQAINKSINLNG